MALTSGQQNKLNKMCPAAESVGLGTQVQDGVVFNIRHRVTTAEVNAGHTLITPPSGKKVRVIDCTLIAIGGNASGATTVDILDGATKLIAAAVAGLTQSAVLRAGAANADVLADGASFVVRAANATISIGKTGNDLATSTAIDVLLSYCLES